MRGIIRGVLVFTSLLVCACESPEQPPVPQAPGKAVARSATIPDSVALDASQGQVTLPHLAHAKRLTCPTCHSELEPGRLAWDKDTVHSYCRDCHKTQGGGPTTCAGCHKK